MPKKKRPSEKPETQFERFVETARKLEVDEKQADTEFKKVSPAKTSMADRKS